MIIQKTREEIEICETGQVIDVTFFSTSTSPQQQLPPLQSGQTSTITT